MEGLQVTLASDLNFSSKKPKTGNRNSYCGFVNRNLPNIATIQISSPSSYKIH